MDHLANLWKARYGTSLPENLLDRQDPSSSILESLLSHRSVRSYRPDPLPPGTVEAAIAAAQSAATSNNLQSWSVIAVEDPARRARLAKLSGNQKHITVAPLFLVWLADLSRLDRIATRLGQPCEALDYTETFLISAIDAALAAQNAVAYLEACGLGTVYIGGLRNHPEEVARELNLPSRCLGLFGLCVGVPDSASEGLGHVKPRLSQTAILHKEQYVTTHEDDEIKAYDAIADLFQQSQGLPSRAWSETMADRISSKEKLGERDTMKASLTALGFPLR